MPTSHTTVNRGATRTVATATLLYALALTGCTTRPVAGIPVPRPTTTSMTTPAATPTTTTATTRSSTPVKASGDDHAQALDTAKRWLAAYRGARWTDTPAAWIDRVRPLITDAMHTRNLELRAAGAGHDWRMFVERRCTSTVTDLDAVIPPEAPADTRTVHVQVAGTIRTTCTAARSPIADDPAAATVTMVLTTTGWRVDQRLY
jgi:hypothetical protein